MLALFLMSTLTVTPSQCRDAYDRMDLATAVQRCQAAITEASPAQMGELYRLLGLAYAALGDEERARAAFIPLATSFSRRLQYPPTKISWHDAACSESR